MAVNVNEFGGGDSKWKTRLICLKYELRQYLVRAAKTVLGRNRKQSSSFVVRHRYTVAQAKRVVVDEGLGQTGGKPSWFYTAFERGDSDPLTNYSLQFIENNVKRDASILVTGCGTGIMVFHLADSGFQNIEGRDLLTKCIRVASRIKNQFNYTETTFLVDDGFKPKLSRSYDLITAMHWVFSAWAGNYGNVTIKDARDPRTWESLLTEILGAYSGNLNKNGLLIIELTDAVADYREVYDHPWGPKSVDIYPVRHSPEQVSRCAESVGLEVVDKKLSVSYGHHPRTSYFLKKS